MIPSLQLALSFRDVEEQSSVTVWVVVFYSCHRYNLLCTIAMQMGTVHSSGKHMSNFL